MHELSIASSIIETVQKETKKHKLTSVSKVRVRIGVLTAVVPDSLLFGFESLVKDTELEETKLEIEMVELQGKCHACLEIFLIQDLKFICPKCLSQQIDTVSGNELEIISLEGEEEGVPQ